MPGSLSPAEATLRAKIGAHASWKNTTDRTARTAKGRAAFEQRFLDEVDPDRTLPEDERNRRAEQARKEYYTRLAYRSARARRNAANDAA